MFSELYNATIGGVQESRVGILHRCLPYLSLVTTPFGTSVIKALAYGGRGKLSYGGSNGSLGYSVDEGVTISAASTNPLTVEIVTDMEFSPVTEGTVCGITSTGVIVVSTNYGKDWASVTSPVASQLNRIVFANDGIAHVVGDTGVYLRSTDKTLATFTQVACGLGTYKLDNIYSGPGFLMISGHSNRLIRSTNGGTTWTAQGAIVTPFVAGDNDALWAIDGHDNLVVIGVYESDIQAKRGQIAISIDGGLTFSSAQSTYFTAIQQRLIRLSYFGKGNLWIGVGDAATMMWSYDLTTWNVINPHPFVTGIVYKAVYADTCMVFGGATGRIGRSAVCFEGSTNTQSAQVDNYTGTYNTIEAVRQAGAIGLTYTQQGIKV